MVNQHSGQSKVAWTQEDTNEALKRMLLYGGIGTGVGAVTRILQHLNTPRPEPYSPRKVFDKLEGRTTIGPAGTPSVIDLPYPTLPKIEDQKTTKLADENLFEPHSIADVPLSLGAGIGGYHAGSQMAGGIINKLFNRKPEVDKEFLKKKLINSRLAYQQALLSQFNLERGAKPVSGGPHESLSFTEMSSPLSLEHINQMSKLSMILDKIYQKMEKSGNQFSDFFSQATLPVSKFLEKFQDPIKSYGKLVIGGGIGLGALGGLAAHAHRQNTLNATDPVEMEPGINDKVFQAIRLRERARAAVGPTEIYPNPIGVPIYDEAPPEQKRRMLQRIGSSKTAAFVDYLFEESHA